MFQSTRTRAQSGCEPTASVKASAVSIQESARVGGPRLRRPQRVVDDEPPDLAEDSLDGLSHMGIPFKLAAEDPVRATACFRFNQSQQEFMDASAQFTTLFDH